MDLYGKDSKWPFAQGSGSTILWVTLGIFPALSFWLRWPNIATALLLFLVVALWLLVLYFFRDPNRQVIDEPGLVIAPGDGEIVAIIQELEPRYLKGQALRISMFLSLTDVHIQRTPLGGQVTLVDHQPGKFLQAFRPEASDVNEYVAMVTESRYGQVLIKQIAGILARRCVNMARPGDVLTTGQRFGLIKFSSRLDLFLPINAQLLIKIGDKVHGGLTPIARLRPAKEEGA
ncbi:MAG: phosphatidylserine decarboxylase [Chloroflexota bacterium]